jgi:hypothetical protein
VKIPFDTTLSSAILERPHGYSLEAGLSGACSLTLQDDSVDCEGSWQAVSYRGVARRSLRTREAGAGLRLGFEGRAVSLLLPTDFPQPGPYGPAMNGKLSCRVDGGESVAVSCEGGREVLLATGLAAGRHQLEIRCVGPVPSPGCWAIESVRSWAQDPVLVSGRLDGGSLLIDVRAEVTGPVAFTRSLRNGRSGEFSLLLPEPGNYRLALSAPGWEPTSAELCAAAGARLELPPLCMRELEPLAVQPRELSADEPLVLVACAHCNTWGAEPAEWLARRVEWINAQRPHAVLLANEVNPAYVAGALRGLNCPWVITDGNHRQMDFSGWRGAGHSELKVAGARILTAGIDTDDAAWRGLLGRFTAEDRLRIVCSYEPFAPEALLAEAGVSFYFYGHDLTRPAYWERAGTTFLRKVDADTFYRIEIGPPHGPGAPVTVKRFTFARDE